MRAEPLAERSACQSNSLIFGGAFAETLGPTDGSEPRALLRRVDESADLARRMLRERA